MKYLFIPFLFLCFTFCNGQDCPENINLLPMYGKKVKCAEQLQIDKDFLQDCDKQFKSRKEASVFFSDKGWQYFYKNDFDTAMKRFNQAWLLDNQNYFAYWGFGNIMGRQQKYKESIVYFEMAKKLGPDNANFYLSSGSSYAMFYGQSKNKEDIRKSIQDFKKCISIDANKGEALAQLTAAYYYLAKKDSASIYLKLTDKINSSLIPDGLRRQLQ